MRLSSVVLITAVIVATLSRPVAAQQRADTAGRDTLHTHILRTRDGSTVIGRLLSDSGDTVRFESNGAMLTLSHAQVADLRAIEPSQMKRGEYWFPDPNRTRLFFGPTGRMLAKGEGYFADADLILIGVNGGLTSNFTMGAGMSLLPSQDPLQNVFFLTPKVGLVEKPDFALAAGALIGFAGFDGIDDKNRSFGVLYGVGSMGSTDNHLDVGAGWGYAGGGISGKPALMVGGATRVSRRVSLLTENYYLPAFEDNGIISYGMRFFGEKVSVDLAFLNAVGPNATFLFPGIPYVSFAVKF